MLANAVSTDVFYCAHGRLMQVGPEFEAIFALKKQDPLSSPPSNPENKKLRCIFTCRDVMCLHDRVWMCSCVYAGRCAEGRVRNDAFAL